MINRILGALLLVAGCGCIGFTMANTYRREVQMLRQMCCFLERIGCELQYRLTPLPQLLRNELEILSGDMHALILDFVIQLESQVTPDVSSCLKASIEKYPGISQRIRMLLFDLGTSLGRFDLNGQLKCLDALQTAVRNELTYLEDKLPGYTRCCHTYALGVGAILALILI